jgi:hypothetical protein
MKMILFPVLLAVSCLVAGLYGALHNQVSYTVSPEYFHAYKFRQFSIPPECHNRLGAALVGWYASWWMGLVVGVPVLLLGLTMPTWRTYLTRSLVAIGVVVVTALAISLAGLAYAVCTLPQSGSPPSWPPDGVHDKVAFARAGTMHDFSYLGGFLGILSGSLYLVVERWRLNRRSNRPPLASPDGPGIVRGQRWPRWVWILGAVALALVIAGLALDWYVTDTINRYYFPRK